MERMQRTSAERKKAADKRWQNPKEKQLTSNAKALHLHSDEKREKKKFGKQIFVQEGTPQFEAWDEYYRRTQGRGCPVSARHGGWWVDEEWPPGHSHN